MIMVFSLTVWKAVVVFLGPFFLVGRIRSPSTRMPLWLLEPCRHFKRIKELVNSSSTVLGSISPREWKKTGGRPSERKSRKETIVEERRSRFRNATRL